MSVFSGAPGRRSATIASIGVIVLLASSAVARAEPTSDEVREEIERLEEEFIGLNAAYNEAKEEHEAAEEKLTDLLADIEAAEKTVDDLSGGVRALANISYIGVDPTSPTQLIGASGPEEALEHQADLTYLSEQQRMGLDRYVDELEHLESLRSEAESTEESAAQALEEAEEATEEAEAAIAEQEELLSELTAEERAEATRNVDNGGENTTTGGGSGGNGSSGGGGGGGSYTGPASGNARTALDFAYSQIGKPYIWGGTGPDGYDCSGLTQAAWGQAGVSLPRTTYDQINAGQRVSWDDKQPGDLLFFYGSSPDHVGLYAGDGVMVHASTSARPIGTVTLNDHYRSNFVAAVRP